MQSSRFDRIVYFDYLRVFATFAVMILHISAQNWYTTDVRGFDWKVFNFYDSIVRWSVPVFVMMSGALFLNREIPVKTIYSKYVLRMAAAFVIWSGIYSFFSAEDNISYISIINGHYHMWFILMIVGLYICIPLIKPLVADENLIKYYLLMAFGFVFLIPQIVTLTIDFAGETVIEMVSAINNNVRNMDIHIVLGYTSYFILGYYLNMIDLDKRQRTIIYVLGVCGGILTIVLDLVVALKTQQAYSNYYGNFTINVLFESIAVFTWFKYKRHYFIKIYPLILKLSEYSFGAYLVHALIIEQLNVRLGLNTLLFNPILSVICIAIVVFFFSFLISALLNHIPLVKKYMV